MFLTLRKRLNYESTTQSDKQTQLGSISWELPPQSLSPWSSERHEFCERQQKQQHVCKNPSQFVVPDMFITTWRQRAANEKTSWSAIAFGKTYDWSYYEGICLAKAMRSMGCGRRPQEIKVAGNNFQWNKQADRNCPRWSISILLAQSLSVHALGRTRETYFLLQHDAGVDGSFGTCHDTADQKILWTCWSTFNSTDISQWAISLHV